MKQSIINIIEKPRSEIILEYIIGMKIEGEIIDINVQNKRNLQRINMFCSLERKQLKKIHQIDI